MVVHNSQVSWCLQMRLSDVLPPGPSWAQLTVTASFNETQAGGAVHRHFKKPPEGFLMCSAISLIGGTKSVLFIIRCPVPCTVLDMK